MSEREQFREHNRPCPRCRKSTQVYRCAGCLVIKEYYCDNCRFHWHEESGDDRHRNRGKDSA